MSLFDAFLNPTNDPSVFPIDPIVASTVRPKPGYEQLGINSILGGALRRRPKRSTSNRRCVRNDLVRISADLFAFDVARGGTSASATMNQIRADLSASTDPYVEEAVGFAGDLTALQVLGRFPDSATI